MKKLLLCLALLLPVVANANPLCKSNAEVAETIMKARQAGVTLIRSEELINKNFGGTESANLFVLIARMAYEEPRYSSEYYQQRAVKDFMDKIYLNCLKAVK